MTEKTFVKITNKMIFDEIQELKNHVIETNGKVKMNKLVSKTSLCLALLALSLITGVNLYGLII